MRIDELQSRLLAYKSSIDIGIDSTVDLEFRKPNSRPELDLDILQEPIIITGIANLNKSEIYDSIHCMQGKREAESSRRLITFQVGEETYHFMFKDKDIATDIASYVSNSIWMFRQNLKHGFVSNNDVINSRIVAEQAFSSQEDERQLAREKYSIQKRHSNEWFITDQIIAQHYADNHKI